MDQQKEEIGLANMQEKKLQNVTSNESYQPQGSQRPLEKTICEMCQHFKYRTLHFLPFKKPSFKLKNATEIVIHMGKKSSLW